ncbi:UDP-N-acetylglucosamine 2-epimerase [Flavobacteriaceae bacterium]|nr:UDP-N-acetylglucosamine 2-epimerase [Flavobacteriaceae bacterium]
MKRKVCVVVTARPSYSRVKTALQAIKDHPNLELQLVLAGASLLERYGSVVNYVEEDGFEIKEKVFMVLEGDTPTAMAKTTGLGVMELANVFFNLKPDMVVTIADRFETIATSIAAAYQNIPLVHLQGGEVTGNIDEKVRHANTKLADIHLVASELASKRVRKLGEDEEYIFNTGCPSIDIAKEVLKSPKLDFDPFEKYGGVGAKFNYKDGYLVVMQHPVTTEYTKSKEQMTHLLNAVSKLDKPTFWFWPNVDAGSDGASSAIRKFRENNDLKKIHFFKNMESNDFLRLLFNSNVLIGNSSVGIRECSFLGVPVVNIGTRQYGRERGRNVLDTGYSEAEISNSIKSQLIKANKHQDFIFGSGDSGLKIAEVLAKVKLRSHKTLTY